MLDQALRAAGGRDLWLASVTVKNEKSGPLSKPGLFECCALAAIRD
jgi:hypothetical protein